jgi:hypothetical protein
MAVATILDHPVDNFVQRQLRKFNGYTVLLWCTLLQLGPIFVDRKGQNLFKIVRIQLKITDDFCLKRKYLEPKVLGNLVSPAHSSFLFLATGLKFSKTHFGWTHSCVNVLQGRTDQHASYSGFQSCPKLLQDTQLHVLSLSWCPPISALSPHSITAAPKNKAEARNETSTTKMVYDPSNRLPI